MRNKISKSVKQIILTLDNNANPNKAVLANLRRTASVTGKGAQDVWPYMYDVLDDTYLSSNGIPTWAEQAIYTALHLYALHQQGNDQLVFEDKRPLFFEIAKLRRNEEKREALDRRMSILLGTSNFNSVVNGITRIVQIAKSEDISFKVDYADLATDLYYFQKGYKSAGEIRLKWGRQYYHNFSNKTNEVD